MLDGPPRMPPLIFVIRTHLAIKYPLDAVHLLHHWRKPEWHRTGIEGKEVLVGVAVTLKLVVRQSHHLDTRRLSLRPTPGLQAFRPVLVCLGRCNRPGTSHRSVPVGTPAIDHHEVEVGGNIESLRLLGEEVAEAGPDFGQRADLLEPENRFVGDGPRTAELGRISIY